MTAYYNEIDPYCCEWLRNLIAVSLIPCGDLDSRSITEVQPDDLRGYKQCHFFAGIGGWAYAARLAGWPDDRELWTGSCPCQPFSVAGKGEGQADARHLWPDWYWLISARRPAVVMGEQVAAAVGKGWLDGVFTDLEEVGYACGAAIVPACAVDAPHRRDRLWFAANQLGASEERQQRSRQLSGWSAAAGASISSGDVGIADSDGCQPRSIAAKAVGYWRSPHATNWSDSEWLVCHDGKARRVKPGVRLLAHGVPARVGRLRAYGNAIVPQAATEVIAAFMDCRP